MCKVFASNLYEKFILYSNLPYEVSLTELFSQCFFSMKIPEEWYA